MSRSPTMLTDLPDEVLLNIAAHCTSATVRNGDLKNLALVSKRWLPIAQEWLLKRPCFNLVDIPKYIWQILHSPQLQGQVQTLEIWSDSTGRLEYTSDGHPKLELYEPTNASTNQGLGDEFIHACTKVVKLFAHDTTHRLRWEAALMDDVLAALIGVLLCLLPNLKRLQLGNSWHWDFCLFTMFLYNPDLLALHGSPLQDWPTSFLTIALKHLAPRLEVLELPTDMSLMPTPPVYSTVYDLRRFHNLKELGITQRGLWVPSRRARIPPDPREIFPPSLEILRISEATKYTAIALENLCTAKKGGHFPALRQVELYYLVSLESVESFVRVKHPLQHISKMFKDAELEIYMYFPVGEMMTWKLPSTPWALRDEGVLKLVDHYLFGKPMPSRWLSVNFSYEGEWDKDGDVIMM